MKISVIIITKNRYDHLENVLKGLNNNTDIDEVVVVHMNETVLPKPAWFKYTYNNTVIQTTSPLPLAQARNEGASLAKGELLIFLDVDCIPCNRLVSDYITAHKKYPDALLMGEVYYLSAEFKQAFGQKSWQENDLITDGESHPLRKYLTEKLFQPEQCYALFWSLNFAVAKKVFWKTIGGFTESYQGYGAEDTDFAFKAQRQKVPLLWVKGATVFHQYHPNYNPPLQHFQDIISNATTFLQYWGKWPMEKWLQLFVEASYIKWISDSQTIEILKIPTKTEIAQAKTLRRY